MTIRPAGYYDIPDYYEPEVVRIIDRFVKPGDCVVDAGASIGYFTCLMSKMVGADGRVVAFEPNLESFEALERNVRQRNLRNVELFRMALWSKDAPALRLWSVAEIGYTSICEYYDTGGVVSSEDVPAKALDNIMVLQPRFMKIDCELAEYEILCGAEKILRGGVDCVVLELNYHLMRQNNMTDHTIRDYMAGLGYDMFLINIGDGKDGLSDPVRVHRDVEIEVKGTTVHHMNVMFSTEEKVREKWKNC